MKFKEIFEEVGNYISLKQFIITLVLVIAILISLINFSPLSSVFETIMGCAAITFVLFLTMISYNIMPPIIRG